MSPKLPAVSGDELIALLKNIGYEILRQRGSHIRLRKTSPSSEHFITVPNHKEIAKGTLNDILSKVSLFNSISKNDLISKL